MSKAPLQSKNDQKKNLGSFGLHSCSAAYSGQGSQKVIVLVCYRFLAAQYGHCQWKGKSTVRSAIVLLFAKEKKDKKKNGKKQKEKKKVMFGSVLFAADHGQGRRHGKSSAWSTAILWFLALLQVAIMGLKK